MLSEQSKARVGNLGGDIGVGTQRMLSGEAEQLIVPDTDTDRPPLEALFPQAARDAAGQHIEDDLDVLVVLEITGSSCTVADGFDRRLIAVPRHRGAVQAVRKARKNLTPFAEPAAQRSLRRVGQISDRVDSVTLQLSFRRSADVQKVGAREGPRDLTVIILSYPGNRIGLFVVAAELRKDFVIRYPDAHGDPQLVFDPAADLFRNRHPVAAPGISGHIQPGLIQTERLDKIGIVPINPAGHLRKAHIQFVVRRHNDKIRAFLPCLPKGFSGLDMIPFRDLVFRQDNPVPLLDVAADRDRLFPDLRSVQAFHGGIKAVAVAVKNDPFQISTPKHMFLY